MPAIRKRKKKRMADIVSIFSAKSIDYFKNMIDFWKNVGEFFTAQEINDEVQETRKNSTGGS